MFNQTDFYCLSIHICNIHTTQRYMFYIIFLKFEQCIYLHAIKLHTFRRQLCMFNSFVAKNSFFYLAFYVVTVSLVSPKTLKQSLFICMNMMSYGKSYQLFNNYSQNIITFKTRLQIHGLFYLNKVLIHARMYLKRIFEIATLHGNLR